MRLAHRICLLAALCAACDASGPEHPDAEAEARAQRGAAPLGAEAAVVGDQRLGADELGAFWAMHPGWTREQAAQAWVAQAALAEEALAGEALDDGALDDARRRGLARAVLARQVEATPLKPVEAAELAQRVEQLRREERPRPAGLQVSHLVVAVPNTVPADQREAQFTLARQALDALLPRVPERPSALELGDIADAAAGQVAAPLIVSSNAHLQFVRPGQPPLEQDELPAGWLPVVPEFAQAAEQWASPERLGQRSEPVRTSFGWHVLVVERIFEGGVADEAVLTARARRQAEAAQRQQLLSTWFAQLLEPVALAIYPKILDDPGQ
jgi:hypothetical protein